MRDGFEELGPEIEDLGAHLCQGVEACESELVLSAHLDLGAFDGRLVAPGAVGQAPEFFDAKFVGKSGGIDEGIGKAIVDGADARRIWIAEIGDLNRRRFSVEDAETISTGVTGEIDENVDLVGADPGGSVFVAFAEDLAPVLEQRFHSLRDGVFLGHVGVGEKLHVLRVVIL